MGWLAAARAAGREGATKENRQFVAAAVEERSPDPTLEHQGEEDR
jgi:hypothetical protein